MNLTTAPVLNMKCNLLELYSTKDLVSIMIDPKWFKHSYRDLGRENIQLNGGGKEAKVQTLELDITEQRQKQEDHGLHVATKFTVNLAKEMVRTGNFTLTRDHVFQIHERILGNVFKNYAGRYRNIMLW